jgi:hypothetical protein
MEAKPESKALSASRIKTLESCSWLYWSNYHLKLPQKQNDGARKGDICHRIFELLLNPKHKERYKKIVKAETVSEVPAIGRLITIYAKEIGLEMSVEVYEQIDKMILVGLKADFFVKGGKLVKPEFQFEIRNESPYYYIKGFIDKPYLVKGKVVIDDFKSSKKKFSGEDKESNMQALLYSLAATKLWPDLIPVVRFIFLQYPEDPMMKISYSKDTLKGFEQYLASVQERIDSFSEKEAKANFAFDQKQASGGEFKGRLMCGFASHPNEKKKDGKPKWYCPYKFAFNYYLIKKDGKIRYSVFEEDRIKVKLKEGETIEFLKYDGCPKFNNPVLNDFGAPLVKRPDMSNILDDF